MKRSELFFGFILLPVDIAMIMAAFLISHYVRVDLEFIPAFSDIGLKTYLTYAIYLMPFWIGLLAMNGLYRMRGNRSFVNEFYRVFSANSTAMLLMVVYIFLSHTLFFSRLIIALTLIISVVTVSLGRTVVRSIQRWFYGYNVGVSRVLLIGDNSTSETLMNSIGRDNMGYKVDGIVNSDGSPSIRGLKVVGSTEELSALVKKRQIDVIILTDSGIQKSKMLELINIASTNNVTFKYVPDVFAFLTTNVTTEFIGALPVMELQPIPMEGWGRVVKRVVDIILALLAIVLASPLMLIATIGTLITSGSPVIYRQKRVGRDGKPFDFYKFRSMYQDKCDYTKEGVGWTTKSDEKTRITPFGNFLRKTNIDETPQFFNVLKGNMSFVGPRPELSKFVEQFQKEIPEYFRRHRVKSGITGWAQVNGLKGDTSIKERVKYDIHYIENWSLRLDFYILYKTLGLIYSEIVGGKAEYRSGSDAAAK